MSSPSGFVPAIARPLKRRKKSLTEKAGGREPSKDKVELEIFGRIRRPFQRKFKTEKASPVTILSQSSTTWYFRLTAYLHKASLL